MILLKLFNFWYQGGMVFFLRVWKHSLMFLEEDLAVGLMWRLLFVPLFHDSSPFGRVLSFFFRSFRILAGFLAYILASLLIFLIALIWFASPFMMVIVLLIPQVRELSLAFGIITLIGVALFIQELMHKPLMHLWHVKELKDLWKTTKLKPSDITWAKLVQTDEVKSFFYLIEADPASFSEITFQVNDQYLRDVWELGKSCQAVFLTPAYFWLVILLEVPGIDIELLKLNIKPKDMVEALKFLELKRNKWRKIYLWDEDFAITHLKGVNRGWLGAPTPALDSVSTDLTQVASFQDLPEFIGREAVVTNVINILSQSSDRNVLLVGQAGAGKTTLVQSLAAKIVAGDAPPALATKRLVELDFTRLLSSVQTQGDLAEKVKGLFEEVQFLQDTIIFVDEIQNMGIGEAATSMNLYSLMLPYLESDRFQFIATTEKMNYAKIIEKNGSLARIFHKVDVPPATVDETIQALEQVAVNLEWHQNIKMTYLAIKVLAELTNKLIHDRVLPDSALSVLKEAEVMAKDGELTSATIKSSLEKRISVPILEVDQSHKDLLLNLEQVIHQKMIDQQEAVGAVSDTLRRSATSLREENRPIGSFLFVGPTGVGKTELAKTLSTVYFKTEGAFIRFDMSEYQTPEAVNRLIGSENNPGELTEAIKNKPYALLLLDEFEKANHQILTLFLQVLEEGRLTDYSGNHVDFSNTIIIATSNAASLTIAQGLQAGQTVEQLEPKVRDELLKIYKPELVNRFDRVVIFKPLSQEDLEKIVLLKLQSLAKNLVEQGYLIQFTPELVSELAKKGFDPVLGARPLRRLIQDTLESKLSKLILENKLVKGNHFLADINLLS